MICDQNVCRSSLSTAWRRRRLEPGLLLIPPREVEKVVDEPGTTTVALVDVPAVELSSITSRPMLGGEE